MRASILVPSTLKCPLLLIINGLGLGFEGVSAKISEAQMPTPRTHSYPASSFPITSGLKRAFRWFRQSSMCSAERRVQVRK